MRFLDVSAHGVTSQEVSSRWSSYVRHGHVDLA